MSRSANPHLLSDDSVPPNDEDTEILPSDAVPATNPALNERETKSIGEYVVDGLIGEGGGGRVFAARHSTLGVRVAIKVLRPEMVPLHHLVTRFNREVEAIQKIDHPSIVRVIETGQTPAGQPYYVMELLEGMNLRRLLQVHGRFSPVEVLDLVSPVCEALGAVHNAGFVHRDIKASNVNVEDKDGQRSVKLLDFGIAKSVHGEAGPGLTEPGVKLGSAHTMAPEQVRCEKLDSRADIYAMGVMLFQLLTGEYPFDADDPRHIALLHLQAPAPRPSSRAPLSAAIDAVVLRCLEKKAERRFPNARELLAALRAAISTDTGADSERELPALGVLLALPTEDDAEIDDAMMEDMMNIFDQVEQCLSNHRFVFPLRAATSLLAVRVGADNSQLQLEREQMQTVLDELNSALAERDAPHPSVRVVLSLRVDSVRCRNAGSEPEIVGGALLELNTWTDSHRIRA
ncbi:MAG TPA: serine/threonine-protein kinase [Polyangiales bacterium]|nr:serine/threonine-protein kinase [Polyangiales bacterium]